MATKHTVQQGECLSSISFRYGFFVDTLWDHPDNSALKDLRKDPTVLKAGDVVSIPDKREREEERPTGKKHRFRRKGVPAKFKTRLLVGDQPRAGLSYVLIVDGQELAGKTTSDGVIERSIWPSARSATLVVRDGDQEERYELQLGDMEPITELAGVQARLRALGFFDDAAGGPAGETDEATRRALAAFQRAHGLPPTGDLDGATRAKVQEQSGG